LEKFGEFGEFLGKSGRFPAAATAMNAAVSCYSAIICE
jgi:hypothetical protein